MQPAARIVAASPRRCVHVRRLTGLFPLQVEAVQLIADGKAPRLPQSEAGASYEGIQRKSNAKVRAPDL